MRATAHSCAFFWPAACASVALLPSLSIPIANMPTQATPTWAVQVPAVELATLFYKRYATPPPAGSGVVVSQLTRVQLSLANSTTAVVELKSLLASCTSMPLFNLKVFAPLRGSMHSYRNAPIVLLLS